MNKNKLADLLHLLPLKFFEIEEVAKKAKRRQLVLLFKLEKNKYYFTGLG